MKELKTISDEKLLRQIQSGNDDAMECLLERYRDMVRKEARSFFLAGGDEEDLIQEGMIGLFKAVTSYPEEMMLRKEELNDYYKMLDQNLSKFEKQVMYHYLNGETYTTIAKKLGKSDKSIDNAIQRIRRKIRNDQES